MLARLRKAMEEKEEGFTLIELLVVMIIIGILAAIAIPIFLNQQKKGYDASVKSDLRTVANEMNTYYTDNQTYAVSSFGTATNSTPNASGTATSIAAANNPVYVAADKISLSKNVTVTLWKYGSNGFCLYGTAGTSGSGTFYIYDNTQGGLLSASQTTATGAQGACTGSY